jgi:hypothetical protein
MTSGDEVVPVNPSEVVAIMKQVKSSNFSSSVARQLAHFSVCLLADDQTKSLPEFPQTGFDSAAIAGNQSAYFFPPLVVRFSTGLNWRCAWATSASLRDR